jgi:hypothetical protein
MAQRICRLIQGILNVGEVLKQLVDFTRPKVTYAVQYGEFLLITAASLHVYFLHILIF